MPENHETPIYDSMSQEEPYDWNTSDPELTETELPSKGEYVPLHGRFTLVSDSEITPNVVLTNPKVRSIANVVLGVLGVALGATMTVDMASDAFDLTPYTAPVFAGYAFLASAFGLAVTTPNIPRG